MGRRDGMRIVLKGASVGSLLRRKAQGPNQAIRGGEGVMEGLPDKESHLL